MIETQFSKCIKNFQSDIALECTQHAFQAILHYYGTIHHLTCLGTSQQNGRAKWKLCHILDTVYALLLSAKIPAPFWDKVALHDVHVINHIPITVIQDQTSYESLFGSPPNYHHLHFFSSTYFVFLQSHEHNKLEPWPRLCCFLGLEKLKRGISVMILSLIIFMSPEMLSFGNVTLLLSSLTSMLACLPPLS